MGGVASATPTRTRINNKQTIVYHRADVTDPSGLREAFGLAAESLGGLQVVVNNAGTAVEDEDHWKHSASAAG